MISNRMRSIHSYSCLCSSTSWIWSSDISGNAGKTPHIFLPKCSAGNCRSQLIGVVHICNKDSLGSQLVCKHFLHVHLISLIHILHLAIAAVKIARFFLLLMSSILQNYWNSSDMKFVPASLTSFLKIPCSEIISWKASFKECVELSGNSLTTENLLW